MDSGRLIFDSSSSRPGHMLILGGSGSHSIFRGARSVLGMEGATNKRRPFFTSPEELLEEEYYDEQLPEKKRRLTPEQVHLLEKSFEAENKLEPERKSELAEKLGLQPRQVAVWFQNRRARWKTKTLERDFDRLRAAYDTLVAEHDSLLKDNGGLRSQVATLTEKLQVKELAVAVGPTGEFGGAEQTPRKGKGEDHLSTGSGGSAVVDGEGPHHQLAAVDSSSGDSCYFQEGFRGGGDGVVGPVDGVHSEDDWSDDGCNYLPAGAMFGESHHHAAAAAAADDDDNWWGVWN